MPIDRATSFQLADEIQKYSQNWRTAPILRENPGMENRLISNLLYALQGDVTKLEYAEFDLPVSGVEGKVGLTAFTEHHIMVATTIPNATSEGQVEILARSGITRLEIEPKQSSFGDIHGFENPNEAKVRIHHARLGAPIIIGLQDHKQDLLQKFIASLLSGLR